MISFTMLPVGSIVSFDYMGQKDVSREPRLARITQHQYDGILATDFDDKDKIKNFKSSGSSNLVLVGGPQATLKTWGDLQAALDSGEATSWLTAFQLADPNVTDVTYNSHIKKFVVTTKNKPSSVKVKILPKNSGVSLNWLNKNGDSFVMELKEGQKPISVETLVQQLTKHYQ